MATEVEAKFRANGPAPLERLTVVERLGAARLGPARRVEEVDRYLDTADGALARARWACRLREREGRTTVSLKGPAESIDPAGWLHRRPEVEGPAAASDDPAGWPPSPARELVERLSGDARLHERFTLRQQRTERPVALDDEPVGTLTLDAVAVERGGQRFGAFHAIELELVEAAHARETDLAALAAVLAEDADLAPDPMTKLDHALALLPHP